MNYRIFYIFFGMLILLIPALTNAAPLIQNNEGALLFKEKCAMCHRKKGMGTGLLARRVQPAQLEARNNLPQEYILIAARNGVGNMPAIPRGEASDEQLQKIAKYLSSSYLTINEEIK